MRSSAEASPRRRFFTYLFTSRTQTSVALGSAPGESSTSYAPSFFTGQGDADRKDASGRRAKQTSGARVWTGTTMAGGLRPSRPPGDPKPGARPAIQMKAGQLERPDGSIARVDRVMPTRTLSTLLAGVGGRLRTLPAGTPDEVILEG